MLNLFSICFQIVALKNNCRGCFAFVQVELEKMEALLLKLSLPDRLQKRPFRRGLLLFSLP